MAQTEFVVEIFYHTSDGDWKETRRVACAKPATAIREAVLRATHAARDNMHRVEVCRASEHAMREASKARTAKTAAR